MCHLTHALPSIRRKDIMLIRMFNQFYIILKSIRINTRNKERRNKFLFLSHFFSYVQKNQFYIKLLNLIIIYQFTHRKLNYR